MKFATLIAATLLTLVAMACLWFPAIPLGVPGEWVWNRHDTPANLLSVMDRLLIPVLSGVVLFAVAVIGRRNLHDASLVSLTFRYVLLLTAAWLWFHQVQQSAPVAHRTLKPLWVLYDRSSAGYFVEAVTGMESTSKFLATYESRMQEGEVLHIGTHPPGLFLLSRYCIDVCESSPSLRSVIAASMNDDAVSAFRTVESEVSPQRPLTQAELCGLQLLMLLTAFAAVLTLVPIAVIVASWYGNVRAWEIASLWMTVPCIAVFFPKSDVLFAFTASTALMFWVLSLRSEKYRLLFAVATAAMLWVGAMMSLAHIPVLVVIVLSAMIRGWTDATLRRPDVYRLAALGTAFVIIGAVWSVINHCNIFHVWMLNLQNHEGFYGEFQRTFWKWLLVNPLEFCLSIGPAIMMVAVAGAGHCLRSLRRSKDAQCRPHTAAAIVLAAMGTVLLLWLSGKNQGEAARLWCFLTPWFLLAVAAGSKSVKPDVASPRTELAVSAGWPALLGIQLLYCLATVSRVNGFSI